MTPPRPINNSGSQYHPQNHQNADPGAHRTFHSAPRVPNCGPVHMGVVHDEARQMSYVGPVQECIMILHRSGSLPALIRFSAAARGAAAGARAGNAAQRSSQGAPGTPPRPTTTPSPQNSPTPPPTNRSSSNSSSSNVGWLDPFLLGTTVVISDFNEMMGWDHWEEASLGERALIVGRTALLLSPIPILGARYTLAAMDRLLGR
jgi:hypothetical protein